MEMPPMRLGQILREARLDAMMTLGQVSLETGIRQNQLSRLELHGCCKMITFETVRKLARLYKVDLNEIAEMLDHARTDQSPGPALYPRAAGPVQKLVG